MPRRGRPSPAAAGSGSSPVPRRCPRVWAQAVPGPSCPLPLTPRSWELMLYGYPLVGIHNRVLCPSLETQQSGLVYMSFTRNLPANEVRPPLVWTRKPPSREGEIIKLVGERAGEAGCGRGWRGRASASSCWEQHRCTLTEPQSNLRGDKRQLAFSTTAFSLVAYPFHSPPCLQGDYPMTGRTLAPSTPSPTQGTPPSSVQGIFGELLQPCSAASRA